MTPTTTDPPQGEQEAHWDLETLTEMRDSQEKRLQGMRSRPVKDLSSSFAIAAVEKNIQSLNRRIMAIKRTEPRA